ncbi:LysR family transcriptional regulator [Massilia sp. Root133]|jgi:DNA-binding transcriptional LysR family regulator|uniref:LysR family transcriptional regulator n=1 Tax=unclassified Massilia TaxID=2609279 RepID=UPI0006F5AD51|nr:MULTISPECIES: LysR family transcriptional regulator [unclassified Massilia]KQY12896.1 LysR family transcriptional regulator [Massilia sp. Root133]KQZ40626.1 LysR family transcriptional regulator [Massilia sp. Root1485]
MDGRLLAEMSVLAAVVETGSFTRAAEVLGLSASGVSRSVARLEAKIGVRLLERTTRALRLTGEGTRLYELAAPHLSGIEEAADAVAGAAAQVRGVLRVSLNPLFVRYVLAPRLPEFLARHPELEIRMLPVPDAADLVAEGVDVAVRFGPQPASSMSSRLLLNTRVLTVAAPAYLKRHGRPKVPQDLAGHECLQYINPQDGRVFDWEFHRGKEVLVVETRGRLTLTDGDALVRACVAGAGVAQMLALGFESLITGGALVDLFPDWPDERFPLYAIRPSRRLPPAAVEAFLDFCTEICRGHA